MWRHCRCSKCRWRYARRTVWQCNAHCTHTHTGTPNSHTHSTSSGRFGVCVLLGFIPCVCFILYRVTPPKQRVQFVKSANNNKINTLHTILEKSNITIFLRIFGDGGKVYVVHWRSFISNSQTFTILSLLCI